MIKEEIKLRICLPISPKKIENYHPINLSYISENKTGRRASKGEKSLKRKIKMTK
jgi:hypothetical protein